MSSHSSLKETSASNAFDNDKEAGNTDVNSVVSGDEADLLRMGYRQVRPSLVLPLHQLTGMVNAGVCTRVYEPKCAFSFGPRVCDES